MCQIPELIERVESNLISIGLKLTVNRSVESKMDVAIEHF